LGVARHLDSHYRGHRLLSIIHSTHVLFGLGAELEGKFCEDVLFTIEQVVGRGLRMEHQPIAPRCDHAGKALQTVPLLWPFKGKPGKGGPEGAVTAFYDHDTAAPAIKLIAIIFHERAHVPAVRVIKEK